MRILLDFEMNKDVETYNGIRIADIEEIQEVYLTPTWDKGSNTDDIPDDLTINLICFRKPYDESICGGYNLDGTPETFDRALENYNKVVNQLMFTGYCKITDFENVTWN